MKLECWIDFIFYHEEDIFLGLGYNVCEFLKKISADTIQNFGHTIKNRQFCVVSYDQSIRTNMNVPFGNFVKVYDSKSNKWWDQFDEFDIWSANENSGFCFD